MVAEIDSDHASSAFDECAKIPKRLGLFKNTECVWLTGNSQVNRIIGDDLKEHARVWSTFVKLSG
jgi:hypothetical protein